MYKENACEGTKKSSEMGKGPVAQRKDLRISLNWGEGGTTV